MIASLPEEFSELDTLQLLQDLLVNTIPRFEFPCFDIFDYELGYLDGGLIAELIVIIKKYHLYIG